MTTMRDFNTLHVPYGFMFAGSMSENQELLHKLKETLYQEYLNARYIYTAKTMWNVYTDRMYDKYKGYKLISEESSTLYESALKYYESGYGNIHLPLFECVFIPDKNKTLGFIPYLHMTENYHSAIVSLPGVEDCSYSPYGKDDSHKKTWEQAVESFEGFYTSLDTEYSQGEPFLLPEQLSSENKEKLAKTMESMKNDEKLSLNIHILEDIAGSKMEEIYNNTNIMQADNSVTALHKARKDTQDWMMDNQAYPVSLPSQISVQGLFARSLETLVKEAFYVDENAVNVLSQKFSDLLHMHIEELREEK